MTSIVFDSDGLIKLAKSGMLEKITDKFNCFISEEVNKESVIEGKNRLYGDAFQIEDLIEKKKLKVKSVELSNNVKGLIKAAQLGYGEISTLELFFKVGGSIIVSEDRTFLNVLNKHGIPFTIPSDLIAQMKKLKILSKKEALGALERIRQYTKESNYLKAKRMIEVM